MARRSNLGIAKQIGRDINKKLAQAVQESAVEIANGLAEAGPAWTGTFSSAWDVVPAGGQGRPPRGGNGVYQYTRRNFPTSRFEKSLERGNNRFEIVNTAPHAAIALDQEESTFRRIGEPVKPLVKEGFRPKSGDEKGEQELHLRSDVAMGYTQEEANAGITAKHDWFPDYAKGGALNRDLKKGVDRAFVRKGGGLP
jgi:hypothetical protein